MKQQPTPSGFVKVLQTREACLSRLTTNKTHSPLPLNEYFPNSPRLAGKYSPMLIGLDDDLQPLCQSVEHLESRAQHEMAIQERPIYWIELC